ncbi:MAG: metallophosphoesterase [Alphaproteobacteria bacterium]|nr:metallophosphoesterase [Alphaproteobacteria bacterium]
MQGFRLGVSLALCAAAGAVAAAPAPTSPRIVAQWRQFGPRGQVETRAAVDGACPAGMTERAAASKDFPRLCVSVAPQPNPDPQRILVLGDTGCRIKGTVVQACNDPKQWPFPVLAASAAKFKPDLVIHVGDYLYRESPCPSGNASCAGTPWGDNWPAWRADFFDPAAPLLAAAPWVIVRGNHEDCARAGSGFARLLAPGAFDGSCLSHIAAFDVPFKALNLVVMDDSDAPDISVDPKVAAIDRAEFAALAGAPTPSWLVMHRPIWGAVKGPLGLALGGNRTMMAALDGHPLPKPVVLTLAGHIHVFEALDYNEAEPPAVLSGNGGDLLDPPPADLSATQFGSKLRVKEGASEEGFGFMLMTRVGKDWNIDLYDATGTFERRCLFSGGHVGCR